MNSLTNSRVNMIGRTLTNYGNISESRRRYYQVKEWQSTE